MPFAAGDTFERYTIEALIGRGGMGEVYRAVDTRLRRKVALKIIRPDKDRPDAAVRLYREARAAAALTHPNAVAVHDVGEADGVFYIVMELVVGQPLLAFVGDARVTIPKKVAWLTDVARTIGAAHRAGIIHRDVKPSNVMVSEDGFAKVLDFGLARPLGPIDPVSFRTQEGRVLGTLRYMAPEQVVGAEADERSDQYSFGLTAYELLAGEHPGGALIDTKPRRIDEIAPNVPADVAIAIEKTLARDPGKRFESMDDVVHALEASIATMRAPPPYMTPPPMETALSTAETQSAEKIAIAMKPSNPPPASNELGRPATLAALAEAGARDPARDSAGSPDATLISKQAPSALLRERDAKKPAATTLPLVASPPRPVASGTPASNPPTPMVAPTPRLHPSSPPPRQSAGVSARPPAPAPKDHRTTIIVSVAVLAVAAFAGTYFGAQRSTAPPVPAQAPTVTFTNVAPPPSPSTKGAPMASASEDESAAASSAPLLTTAKPTTPPPTAPAKPKAPSFSNTR